MTRPIPPLGPTSKFPTSIDKALVALAAVEARRRPSPPSVARTDVAVDIPVVLVDLLASALCLADPPAPPAGPNVSLLIKEVEETVLVFVKASGGGGSGSGNVRAPPPPLSSLTAPPTVEALTEKSEEDVCVEEEGVEMDEC